MSWFITDPAGVTVASAGADDTEYSIGSCAPPTLMPTPAPCFTLSLDDSYGDGWNGNHWHCIHPTGAESTGTLSHGKSGTAQLCVAMDKCHKFKVDTAGDWESEISWSIADPSGSSVSSGGADDVEHDIGNCRAV